MLSAGQTWIQSLTRPWEPYLIKHRAKHAWCNSEHINTWTLTQSQKNSLDFKIRSLPWEFLKCNSWHTDVDIEKAKIEIPVPTQGFSGALKGATGHVPETQEEAENFLERPRNSGMVRRFMGVSRRGREERKPKIYFWVHESSLRKGKWTKLGGQGRKEAPALDCFISEHNHGEISARSMPGQRVSEKNMGSGIILAPTQNPALSLSHFMTLRQGLSLPVSSVTGD